MIVCAAILAPVFAGAPGAAVAQSDSDEWRFSLTPYLWLPTIEGTLSFSVPPGGGGSPPDVRAGPTDWLDLLNTGLLIGAKFRF